MHLVINIRRQTLSCSHASCQRMEVSDGKWHRLVID
uniref:Uncharacterized protein n=1 Tax=Picea glauca TaxID=3330 RepID=A0A101M4C2_PICGL|nr:hypothetical protein ABT39_MTgene675 [Picea glauca]